VTPPSGWTSRSIGEVFIVLGGGTPSTKHSDYWSGSIPWISSADVGENIRDITVRRSITEDAIASSAANVVPPETVVVVARVGVGKVAVAGRNLAYSQDCQGLLPQPDVDPTFTAYQLKTLASEMKFRSQGTTISGITKKQLLSMPFSYPPLPEQGQIVEAIEEQFSRLNAAEESLLSARRRAKHLWASALSRLISGTLTPLGEVLSEGMTNGHSVPNKDEGFPVLRLNALNNGEVNLAERKGGDWTWAQAERYIVRAGDFLIARGNGSIRLVGRGGLVREDDEVAFPDTMIRVRLNSVRVSPRYLRLVWDSSGVRMQIERAARTTAGIYKINQQDLKRILVPCPSLEEQDEAVAEAERLASSISHVDSEVGLASSRASGLRRAILGHAFSGQLVSSGG
jgi:type I restriction enzyme S subunit